MTTTDERPTCPVGWCALDPGHDGDCSLIRERQWAALVELQRELGASLQHFADQWREFAALFTAAQQDRTQQDYTLCCPDSEPSIDGPTDKP